MQFYNSILFYFINYIELNFYFSIIIFFIFLVIYSSFSLPGLILFFAISGYFYGISIGFIISVFSLTLGSFIFFIVSKFFLLDFFLRHFKDYINNINKYIKNSSFEYLVILRMIPGPPLLVQNILISFLKISNYKFLFATFLGFSPIVFFSVLIGNKFKNIKSFNSFNSSEIFTWDFFLIIIIFIIIIVLRIFLKKKPSNL